MPEEPKYYHHGCGSSSSCNLEAVQKGYTQLKTGLANTAEGAGMRSKAEFDTMLADVETPRATGTKGDRE
jgi:hypothetical protein